LGKPYGAVQQWGHVMRIDKEQGEFILPDTGFLFYSTEQKTNTTENTHFKLFDIL
jgi:hypothetical protein